MLGRRRPPGQARGARMRRKCKAARPGGSAMARVVLSAGNRVGMEGGVRVLAILTVRNEGSFLIDWLAYHRRAGFTDFLVSSNDCDDGTDRMLDRLAEMGWLTHVPNPGPHAKGAHFEALKKAERHPLFRACDWAAGIDIDEFLTVHVGDHTVQALLDALPPTDAVALTWRMFGNGGVVSLTDDPVTEVFTRAAPPALFWPWRAQMFKTLFRPALFPKPGIHRPRGPHQGQRWHDGSGRAIPNGPSRLFSPLGQDNVQLAQLNHYALGTMEGYLVKCDRGRANRDAAGFDTGYWVERNFSAVEDRSALRLDCRELRAELRADPVLGPLHDAAFAWRKQRFVQLMQDEPWRALFGRLLLAPPSRVLTLEEARILWSFARG